MTDTQNPGGWPDAAQPDRLLSSVVSVMAEAVDEIERLRAAVETARQEGFVVGGEEALLHALHPEFGSIYDEDGEATAAHKAGRREGIEAARPLLNAVDEVLAGLARGECEQHMLNQLAPVVAAIRALLEDGR